MRAAATLAFVVDGRQRGCRRGLPQPPSKTHRKANSAEQQESFKVGSLDAGIIAESELRKSAHQTFVLEPTGGVCSRCLTRKNGLAAVGKSFLGSLPGLLPTSADKGLTHGTPIIHASREGKRGIAFEVVQEADAVYCAAYGTEDTFPDGNGGEPLCTDVLAMTIFAILRPVPQRVRLQEVRDAPLRHAYHRHPVARLATD